MADFSNHRRFSLRCLSKDLIPVSVRLKSNIKTPKGRQIIKKAERALLSERIRSINNSIAMFTIQRDTCMNKLKDNLDKEIMEECERFIKEKREIRHLRTFVCQVSKFERLCHKKTGGHIKNQHGERTIHVEDQPKTNQVTNINNREMEIEEERTEQVNNTKNIWVKNLSKTPLTEVQERLLAYRPNIAIVPREPPVLEYITAIERTCSQLQQGKAEELRGEIKAIIKKTPPPKLDITKEEHQALRQLKKDENRMVLTADKGVSLAVLDKEDYIQKAEELLQQQPNYKILPSDPTTKHKNKLIALLKAIKTDGGINDSLYKKLYPTGASSPKFYGLPKVHKEGIPLRPIVSSIGSVSH